ncbi:MAG TPA: Ppx/GppA family phosphatase, partial [Candidatus Methylomirabilis sp.]
MPLAVIDLGTNTVRLLVAQPDSRGGYRSLFADQEITRLGQGLLPDRALQPEPIRRTLRVLRRFREEAEARGVVRTLAVGTSALREATNRDTFL